MTARLWAIFLAVAGAAFAVLEGYALNTETPTLSQVVWTLNDRWPIVGVIVCLGAGLVCGHWFWGRK